jgi:hypothetical protein
MCLSNARVLCRFVSIGRALRMTVRLQEQRVCQTYATIEKQNAEHDCYAFE